MEKERKLKFYNKSPVIVAGNTLSGKRLISVDALRGFIMLIMAIDHASYFVGKHHFAEFWGIELPRYHDFFTFFTRFITHVCAPGFFFLMGFSMVLFAASRRKIGWSENRITRYFIIRGLLLIFLQLFIENPAWFLGFMSAQFKTEKLILPPGSGDVIYFNFGVLYGLGASMIICTLFLKLKPMLIILVSMCVFLASQLLIPTSENAITPYPVLVRLLLIPGQTDIWQVMYSIIPWFGITGLGLAFGKKFLENKTIIKKVTLISGIFTIIIFFIIRSANGFGNHHLYENFSWISFFNITKYPPSLAFITLTTGIILLLFLLFTEIPERFFNRTKVLPAYGKSALFFYITHLYLFALIGFLFPEGANLRLIYLTWILVLTILYPLCTWYGNFKKRSSPASLWRFF